MSPVTIKDLEAIVNRINRITESPLIPWTCNKSGKYRANIGNYHLDGAYGGWALHRMVSEGGGITDVLRVGHVSKREIQKLMFVFITGLEERNASQ